MWSRVLVVICLTSLLASCSVSGRALCPTPPGSLLVQAGPLGQPGQPPAKTQKEVLEQYVEDIGRYEDLRARHNELIWWWETNCLEDK
jgi:hypothetical protein